jgi:plastocyanin
VLDGFTATKQIPPSSQIDFTTPGTYRFVCLIHPFMVGTVVVK